MNFPVISQQKNEKTQNLKRIYQLVRRMSPVTRTELAKRTGLSLMTITNLVDYLYSEGVLLIDNNKSDNKRGRKADLVSLNLNNLCVMVLDITQEHFHFSVMDLGASAIAIPFYWRNNPAQTYIKNFDAFLRYVRTVTERAGYLTKLAGIGVSVPGPYIPEKDQVFNRRIPGLDDVPVKAVIEARFTGVKVYIDEDVKFAAHYHIHGDEDRTGEVMVYVYIGEGMGGAIVNENRIIRGRNSIAGDMGQLLADRNGANYESLLSLSALYRRILGKKPVDYDANDMLQALIAFQNEKPARVAKALFGIYDAIVRLLYNLLWFVDPHTIVIECEYLPALDKAYADKIRRRLLERTEGLLPAVPEIIFESNRRKDSHAGAALYIIERWLNDE